MPEKTIIFALVTFLHDLFTAIWVGGMVALLLVVIPAARGLFGRGPQTKQFLLAVQSRLSKLVYVSMAGLVVTGLLLSRRAAGFDGLFGFGSPFAVVLSIKHILVVAMIVVALVRSLVFGRAVGPSTPAREKQSVLLLALNVGLAVAVLVLSGFGAVLGAMPAV